MAGEIDLIDLSPPRGRMGLAPMDLYVLIGLFVVDELMNLPVWDRWALTGRFTRCANVVARSNPI